MNPMCLITRSSAMALAVMIGLVYLVPAGLASAYRLGERTAAEMQIVVPDAPAALQWILVDRDECPDTDTGGWEL